MNGSVSPPLVAALLGFLAGSLAADDLNDALGVGVAITGLFFGVARSAAVLRGRSRKEIERAGAFGFAIGLAASALAFAVLAIL